MRLNKTTAQAGTSLPELMVTVLLIGTFFASIFEVNAVCLRYINATKESVAAIESVQDRMEKLRSLAFTDLTKTSYMKDTVLIAPANASVQAKRVTEEVTISDYNDPSTSLTYTRAAGASVAPSNTPAGAFSFPATTSIVKVKVKHTWNMTLNGRTRSEETESIISNGVKK